MKKRHQSTILVLDKDQKKTSTYQINSWLLQNLKPTIVALSATSILLTAGLITLGVKYYQAHTTNTELRTQVEFLDGYTSAEAAAKISELKKTEKTVNELENYLQERGANNPAPKGKEEGTTGTQLGIGGEFHPISASAPFSADYNLNAQKLLAAARTVPLGVPHAGVLNSRFGKRGNPFGGGSGEFHQGLDFKGEIGEPIKATADGEVIQAGHVGGYGNAIKIKHGFGYETLYGHLSEINVTAGQQVKAGDEIGKLGNTGRSTGPHLHYEVRLTGTAVDPENFLTLNK